MIKSTCQTRKTALYFEAKIVGIFGAEKAEEIVKVCVKAGFPFSSYKIKWGMLLLEETWVWDKGADDKKYFESLAKCITSIVQTPRITITVYRKLPEKTLEYRSLHLVRLEEK